jgi:hypothetical protein
MNDYFLSKDKTHNRNEEGEEAIIIPSKIIKIDVYYPKNGILKNIKGNSLGNELKSFKCPIKFIEY